MVKIIRRIAMAVRPRVALQMFSMEGNSTVEMDTTVTCRLRRDESFKPTTKSSIIRPRDKCHHWPGQLVCAEVDTERRWMCYLNIRVFLNSTTKTFHLFPSSATSYRRRIYIVLLIFSFFPFAKNAYFLSRENTTRIPSH